MKTWFLLALGFFGLSTWSSPNFAAEEVFAQLEVSLDAKLEKNAKNIRTLYIIAYEDGAKMPYGALKVELKVDAKGQVFQGKLTSTNLQVMVPGKPVPKVLRFKARLDVDGSAGADQPGDLVGLVEKINLAGSAKILIDKAI